MKILNLHCDYIKFKPLKKALQKIESLDEKEKKEIHVTDPLVVLTAVEKKDSNIELVVEKLIKEVKEIADSVGAENIVLYPYAHLSSELADAETAIEILAKSAKGLSKFFNVSQAPFGYYKEFELKVKGHPLSELSREIKIEGNEAEETFDPKQLLKEISKSKLDTSKLKENDHRIIGKQMDLFSFNEVAPGMIFWHNNGLIIYNELIKFWREMHRDYSYQEIKTPQIMDSKLWKISGHWEKYKENNFTTEYEKRKFLVKPMNCPGGMLVYKNSPKSYKDLPLRVGEIGMVHRVELSGVLAGLFRVIQFTQDDAHIFCTEKQLEDEIALVMEIIDLFYKKFNLQFDHVELSTRPEKRIGNDKEWDVAESTLKNVLIKKKMNFKINEGDGAFYGPKIDFHIKDSLGRTWQCSTIQLDFAMPERFDLEYTSKNNSKKRPIMLHRVIYGSLERFIGVLIESSRGWMPTWLAPIQVRIINFTDRNQNYAKEILEKLKSEIPNLRVDFDFEQKTVPSKIKESSLMRIPYVVVVGDKEQENNSLAVRIKGSREIQKFSIEEFISKIKKELEERL